MAATREKICEIEDVDRLRKVVMKSGDISCAKCCARSDDPSSLCAPVSSPNKNLFCE